jgi:hypothetical protein
MHGSGCAVRNADTRKAHAYRQASFCFGFSVGEQVQVHRVLFRLKMFLLDNSVKGQENVYWLPAKMLFAAAENSEKGDLNR